MSSLRGWLVVAASLLGAAPAAAAVSLVQVGTFTEPIFVTALPGDAGTLAVVEHGGRIKLLRGGQVSMFLDLNAAGLAPDAGGTNERGTLSVAFAPDYATSRKLYVFYTAKADGALTVDEFTAAADGLSAAASTRRNLLSVPHDRQTNHNGGQLQFAPDGTLLAGTGDGGSGGDPSGNGQYTGPPAGVVNGVNHDGRLGKLLRVDRVAGGSSFYAIGLRNPFRFSFDRLTGDLTIGDVGQGAVEEIDFRPAAAGRGEGDNFGWNAFEGNQAFSGGAPVNPAYPLRAPVITHSHSDGWCSITGGYVVRDPDLPELAGQYVYTDYCKGEIWAATLAPGAATGDRALGLHVDMPSSFGEDACGRVYVASLGTGGVYRLSSGAPDTCTPAPPFAPPPAGGGTVSPAVTDRVAPRVALVGGTRAQHPLRTGRVSVHLRCDQQCAIVAKSRFVVHGSKVLLRLRTLRRLIAKDAVVRFDLKFDARVRRGLARWFKRGRRITARVSVRAIDASGNDRSRTFTIRLAR